jgi:hypothetical protein
MGSEMQPGVMKAQKREILISHVKKILYISYKTCQNSQIILKNREKSTKTRKPEITFKNLKFQDFFILEISFLHLSPYVIGLKQ